MLKRREALEVATPAWVFNPAKLRGNIGAFRRAFRDAGVEVTVGYSVKTNSLRPLLSSCLDAGCMAEVVSDDEWRLAREAGFAPSHIIYNGVAKGRGSFIEAVRAGAVVNIDTHREIDWLGDIADGCPIDVGVRISIDLGRLAPTLSDGRDDMSRFGFSDETGELAEVLTRLRAIPGVRIAGLHMHRNIASRRVELYRRLVDYAATLMRKHGIEPSYLDLGGGFSATLPGKPSPEQYARAIASELKKHGLMDLRIIIEPGNALAASALSFVTEVVDCKQMRPGEWVVTVDGRRNDVDPLFRHNDLNFSVVSVDRASTAETRACQTIVGATCMEFDRIATMRDAVALAPGDRIMFHNVGAYTHTLAPRFILFRSNLYSLESGRLIKLVADAHL